MGFQLIISYVRHGLFLTLGFTLLWASTNIQVSAASKFEPIPTQFIAALVDPSAKSGTGAQHWGIWKQDPGPRGVWLKLYSVLRATGGYAPAMWKHDDKDWWLDENGLIMEKPQFPLSAGRYQVTGDRETVSILTIHEADNSGEMKWELSDSANIHDVTHLGCRSSRFTPINFANQCSPENAPIPAFPISIGTKMPDIQHCNKQDYSVLFVIGREIKG